MKIIRKSEIQQDDRPDGRTIQKFLSKSYDIPINSILMLTSEIPKGVHEPTHYHSDSTEIFYFLTPGNITIESKDYKLSEGDMVVLERNDKHSIKAETYMKLLVIKYPDVQDKVIVE